MQAAWGVAAAAGAVALGAVFADHARTRRRDLDRVGWVPWPLVLVTALFVGAVAVARALGR